MAKQTLECLRCGETRTPLPAPLRRLEAGECPRCRYVGWALSVELTETVRRLLRERPPERRRMRAA
jgi:DNA-directed RNA polymerase subunit RPC12/RpoP